MLFCCLESEDPKGKKLHNDSKPEESKQNTESSARNSPDFNKKKS